MENVEAGIIAKLLKALPKYLGNGINEVVKRGIKVEESKPVDGKNYDSGIIFVATSGKGTVIKCKVVPVPERKGRFNMYIKSKDGKKASYPSISQDQMDDKITEFFDKFYGEAFEDADNNEDDFNMEEFNEDEDAKNQSADSDDASSASKLFMKLSKVTSGTDVHVNLESVMANYNTVSALADMTAVVNNDDFVSLLSETPKCYEVTTVDGQLDVADSEDMPQFNPFAELLKGYYVATLNLDYLSTNYSDSSMNRLDPYYMSSDIRYWIHNIVTIAKVSGCCTPNPIDLLQGQVGILCDQSQQGSCSMKSVLETLLATIELYYANFSHDIQSILDDNIIQIKTYIMNTGVAQC